MKASSLSSVPASSTVMDSLATSTTRPRKSSTISMTSRRFSALQETVTAQVGSM